MIYQHTAKFVTPLDNYRLLIRFVDGYTKIYDVKPCFKKWPIFNELKKNNLFNKVRVTQDGCIVWNDKIDLDDEEVYENSQIVETPFDGLLSFKDASELWGLEESTLRKAVQYKKLKVGVDIMKFGKQWVITIEAMIKHYGPKK